LSTIQFRYKDLGKQLKHLVASLLLCFCFITESAADNRYNNNDWRSLPFIEMMATMMKIMNDIMAGGNNSYSGLNTLPYSPAFMPYSPYGMNNYLSGFNNLPMSPTGMGNFPTTNMANMLPDDFQAGKNTSNTMNDFWDPNAQQKNSFTRSKSSTTYNDLNGIWQALSGDVIAIYRDSYFIWSDGLSRNLAGRLMIKGNNLYAYIPASKTTLQFQFYREAGQFIVRDKTSRVYTFKRLH